MMKNGAEAFEACIQSERLRMVFRHWNDARGERAMPARSEIDPQRLGRALSSVWIYERGDDGEYRCRLAGEDINAAHKKSIMKRPAREIFGPDYDFPIRQRMNFVLDTPAVLYGSMILSADHRSVSRISLPLRDQAGLPRFTFGATEYIDMDWIDDRNPSLIGRVDDIDVFRLPDFQRIPAEELP